MGWLDFMSQSPQIGSFISIQGRGRRRRRGREVSIPSNRVVHFDIVETTELGENGKSQSPQIGSFISMPPWPRLPNLPNPRLNPLKSGRSFR